MSVETDAYLTRVRARLAKAGDPLARARLANDEISALAGTLEALGQLRADAVRDARDTMSAVAVADALGVTRARVYQISDAK